MFIAYSLVETTRMDALRYVLMRIKILENGGFPEAEDVNAPDNEQDVGDDDQTSDEFPFPISQ